MKFFDFHIQGRDHDSSLRLLLEASRLGYQGGVLVYPSDRYPALKSDLESLRENPELRDFEIARGVMINASDPRDMRRSVNKFRKKADVIYVSGGNLKVNRAACESRRVDVLSAPYTSRRDPGINHVLAREAARNNVAVELPLADVIGSWLKVRARVLEQFREILKLHRKFGFPLLLTSRASSIYDLRTPGDIMNLAECFGMESSEAEESLTSTPASILEDSGNRHLLIAEGVRLLPES
ncbi:ribonuclease P protein component 3 [Methanothermobacter defluvii]|jgi:ribonuclease P/MRP protein subunit RPP1|nr:ribonuclease protein subunit [Methanothermobacter sp.]MDN5374693.1 ribonuclease protein subunit [Methanothermobacter sp.]REE28667.1 ribonuclease P protein subunit Rpp30 [Methanothermobacter defluvii]